MGAKLKTTGLAGPKLKTNNFHKFFLIVNIIQFKKKNFNVTRYTLSGAIFIGFFEVFWIFLKWTWKGQRYTEPGGVEKIKPYVLDKSAFS